VSTSSSEGVLRFQLRTFGRGLNLVECGSHNTSEIEELIDIVNVTVTARKA
jgi:hypothetical protein